MLLLDFLQNGGLLVFLLERVDQMGEHLQGGGFLLLLLQVHDHIVDQFDFGLVRLDFLNQFAEECSCSILDILLVRGNDDLPVDFDSFEEESLFLGICHIITAPTYFDISESN